MKKLAKIAAVISLLSLFLIGCSSSYHPDTSQNNINSTEIQNLKA